MLFKELNSEEARVIGDCLKAAIQGPFFPEWEFHTLFGLSRDEVRQVEREWPSAADEEKSVVAAVGTLNNLLGYPHGYDLKALVGHSEEALIPILRKIAEDKRYL